MNSTIKYERYLDRSSFSIMIASTLMLLYYTVATTVSLDTLMSLLVLSYGRITQDTMSGCEINLYCITTTAYSRVDPVNHIPD